jgi:hypothetical protein
MDIRTCYETLELTPDATIEEVKQAYKDLVNIWHPDRVSNNPRLKQKAEEKLKQINAAHEGLLSYLNSRHKGPTAVERAARPEQKKENTAQQETRAHIDGADRPENRIKTGAGIVSILWSHFSNLVHRLADTRLVPGNGTGAESRSSGPVLGTRRNGRGGGGGAGRGRYKGRGGRGMGRGKGMGGGRRRS